MDQLNYDIGLVIARIFLGVLFLLQGYDKVFVIGLGEVSHTFQQQLQRNRLPALLIRVSAYYTSYVEFIGGLFLILGLFKSYVLYALGLDLIMVAVAMGLIEPLWKLDFVFPRLALVLLLLLLPEGSQLFSLDEVFGV